MRFALCTLAMVTLSIGACGDTKRETDDASDADGGDTASTAGSGASSTGGGPGTGGSGGVGLQTTCDDLGFCGQQDDPGCVSCAVEDGSCVDELDACDNECLLLNDCYFDCENDDPSCFSQCEDMHPDGIASVNALYTCILCDECPVSCNFDTTNCG
jgi:hypothetical protein